MVINNNLEPGAYKYKESLKNITAGMKKVLYICQALTAVILFTQWDLQGQARYISCPCVRFLVQCAVWPGLVMVRALSMLSVRGKQQ